ncbi:MAG: hypothetical protein JWN34_2016 [Bryobacterales bacterium]|nr:hypothetical protein [Bryobacterales bacterium]
MTEKKPVTIKIDGTEWPIELDTNDLIEVEEMTGHNVLMGAVNLMLPSFGLLRALLYVALKKGGAKFKLEEVADFIEMDNAVELRDSLIAAWRGDMVAVSVPTPSAQ